jgi:protein SCO1
MPDWVAALPAVNASLNGFATVLLMAGYVAIRQRRVHTHKQLMLTAFATSIAFLMCYLVYHAALHQYTGESGKKFLGTGVIRPIYFTILITHVTLAAAVPVLACLTIYRGLKQQWDRHRRIAIITFPIWLYVSVTGVVIYGLLYHWPAS